MPPKTHSVLAPSKKEWIHCAQAAKFLSLQEYDEPNEAAQFGSEAHELAEAYIIESLKLMPYDGTETRTSKDVKATLTMYNESMELLASAYANFVVDTAAYEEHRTGEKPIVLVEQLLEMDYAPNTHGTADAIIIAGDTLTIIDNKTGFIKVTAEEDGDLNSQLAIYGLYAYKTYKQFYPITKIRLVIFQERIHNVSEITVSVDDLERWEREILVPAVKNAMSDNPVASSGWFCKYCFGKSICRQRSEDALSAVGEMKQPTLMTDDEIEQLLPKLDNIADYITAVKEYALKKAVEQGKQWQGYDLGETTTKRKFSDETKVAQILTDAGFQPYAKPKLQSITDLQKLVGKTKFNELVGGLVTKPKGQPTLVKKGESQKC